MKRLWNVLSIVAVVNLTAVVGLVGWLAASGRLTRDSLVKVREVLAAPETSATKGDLASEMAKDEGRDVTPIAAQLSAADRLAQQTSMSMRRLRDESEQLARQLKDNEAELKAREEAFAAERKQWEQATADARAQATDEQFRKAVKTLESVPPKQAKEWILALAATGNVDQAVDYLNAMSPYKSAGVFKTFKGDEENKVATDLLERLRLRSPDGGVASASSRTSSPHDAGSSTNSPSSVPDASRPVANAGAEVDGASGARR